MMKTKEEKEIILIKCICQVFDFFDIKTLTYARNTCKITMFSRQEWLQPTSVSLLELEYLIKLLDENGVKRGVDYFDIEVDFNHSNKTVQHSELDFTFILNSR